MRNSCFISKRAVLTGKEAGDQAIWRIVGDSGPIVEVMLTCSSPKACRPWGLFAHRLDGGPKSRCSSWRLVAARGGRRTALTSPIFPLLQKHWSPPSDSSP